MINFRGLTFIGIVTFLVACGSGSSPDPEPSEPAISRPEALANSEAADSTSFIIENTSTSSLTWSISVENDADNPDEGDWFSVAPKSGTLGAGEQTDIVLTLLGGLTEGTYNSELTVSYPGGTTPFTVTGVVGEDAPEPSGSFTLSTNPDYSQPPALTVTPDSGGFVGIGIDRQNGFSEDVSLSLLGAPEGVSGVFDPQVAAGSNSSLTVTTSDGVATGDYELTVKGAGGGKSATTKVLLSVINGTNPETFNLAVSPSNLNITQGSSRTAELTLKRSGGFSGDVTLAAKNVPPGVSVSFSPKTTSNSSEVKVSVGNSAEAGTYQLTLEGTSGGKTTTTKLGLTVSEAAAETGEITGTLRTDNFLGDFSVPDSQSGFRALLDAARPEYVPGEVIVKYRDSAQSLSREAAGEPSGQGVLELARSYGLSVKKARADDVAVFALPEGKTVPEMVAQLAQDPAVVYAEPNYYIYPMSIPNDPEFDRQWNMAVAGVPVAWDARDTATNITVAVVDSGFDLNHPDLEFINDGYDFCGVKDCAGRDGNVSPDGPNDTHGTHLAGIVAAQGNNSRGVAGVLKGGANLVPVKIYYNFEPTTLVTLANGIRWAAGLSVSGVTNNPNPADIINLSVGTLSDSNLIREAVEEAQATGALLIAAAGNVIEPAPIYPAGYPGVVSVGSINSAFELSCFSNTVNVDLVAPGGDGLIEGCEKSEAIFSTIPGGYGTLTGTSQAAPLVAGIAALIWSQDTSLTSAQVTSRLKASAYKPSGASGGYGAGVVRADAAFGFAEIGDSISVSASGPDSQVDTVTLREDGESTAFALGGLKPGSYTVEAEAEKLSGSKTVSLSEGESEEVTIRLEP